MIKRPLFRDQIYKDIRAGTVVAFFALPLTISIGFASSVSPLQGVLTGAIGGLCVALFGGSRVQIGGPTAVFLLMAAGIVTQFGLWGLLIAGALAGVILIVLGLLRWASAIRYVPQPIIIGLLAGVAVAIFISQWKDLFGLVGAKQPGDAIGKILAFFQFFSSMNGWAFAIGTLSFLIAALFGRFAPRFPGAFFALLVSTIVALIFRLPVETLGKTFTSGAPMLVLPEFNLQMGQLLQLLPAAFAIAFFAAVESLLSASVADGMFGGTHRPNKELVGQGVANLVNAVLGGIPVSGAIARTSANVRSGARTPVAAVVQSLLLFIFFWVGGSLVTVIPLPAIAGLLLYVAYKMSDWREFFSVLKTTRTDAAVLLLTFIVTVFLDSVYGILCGLVVAVILFFVNRSQDGPSVEIFAASEEASSREHQPQVALPPGTYVLDLNGAFFFGAVSKFEESVRPILPKAKALVLRMRDVDLLDATGTRVLHRILNQARSFRVRVVVSEIHPTILQVMEHADLIQHIGTSNLFASFDGAIKDVWSAQPLVFSTNSKDTTLDPI